MGVTAYNDVFNSLMDSQKIRLKEISSELHEEFMENGNLISIAYVYPDGVIDNIGIEIDGLFNKKAWNTYARWYQVLNASLNETARLIADKMNGIPLEATSSGLSSHVNTVKKYFPSVVSHRVHAELSGIGWRGRNSLIVNPLYSCMIRLAGIITSQTLHLTDRTSESCGNCTSCLEVCSFLKHRDRLDDYREQCLTYMNSLKLEDEVCGKCIKACVHSPKFTSRMKTLQHNSLDNVFYTQISP
jgi:epoxyqueuosine reductase QueG